MSAVDALGAACWRWLDEHVDEFLVRPGDDPPTRALRIRAFGELLIFAASSLRLGGAPAPFERVAGIALAWLPAFDWESQLMRDPAFVVAILTVVEFVEASGGDAAPYRALAENALELGLVDRLDLRPYRQLELQRLLVRARFRRDDAAAFAAQARHALRLLDKPPSTYTVNDYFALSHLACYVCDDGERDPSVVLGLADAARLRWLVGTVGRFALIDGDLDLAAEFVLCERFLGGFDGAFTREAVRRAIAQQEPDGCVLAPDPDGTRTAFVRRYHSTLLWAYASLLVRRGRAPLAA